MASTDPDYEELEGEPATPFDVAHDLVLQFVEDFDVYTEGGGNELAGAFIEEMGWENASNGELKILLTDGTAILLTVDVELPE